MVDRRMIEEIVAEVLKRQNPVKRPPLYMIRRSEPERATIRNLEEHWDVKWINPSHSEYPEDITAAYFPEVDQDFLAKSALGLADTVESKWFARLMKGKATVYMTLEKELADFLEESVPYASMLNAYVSKLETFSVRVTDKGGKIVPEDSRVESPVFFSGPLLTEKEMEEWKHGEIHIKNSTIITPLARDAARDRDIVILHK